MKALQAALEVLDPHESITAATVVAYLEANGLKTPITTERMTDEQLRKECSRRGMTHLSIGQWSDELVAAEHKRREDLGRIEHIFRDDYEMGFAGGRHTITGTALCGKLLADNGNWTAVTQATFREHAGYRSYCAECVKAHDKTPTVETPADARGRNGDIVRVDS